MSMMPQKLIAAIDTPDPVRAAALVRAVGPHCGLVKLGLEFFLANGPAGVAAFADTRLFLDLKLHDIPNTVGKAVGSLAALNVAMLTVHAAGGAKMIAAAVAASHAKGPSRPLILAVTVLTSLDAHALYETGVSGGTTQQVLRLGRLALEAGADGLICSAHELGPLRDTFGPAPVLVVPGIRPPGSEIGDQARVMTPQAAVQAGASYIVVGRPITEAADPAAAAAAISGMITGVNTEMAL